MRVRGIQVLIRPFLASVFFIASSSNEEKLIYHTVSGAGMGYLCFVHVSTEDSTFWNSHYIIRSFFFCTFSHIHTSLGETGSVGIWSKDIKNKTPNISTTMFDKILKKLGMHLILPHYFSVHSLQTGPYIYIWNTHLSFNCTPTSCFSAYKPSEPRDDQTFQIRCLQA